MWRGVNVGRVFRSPVRRRRPRTCWGIRRGGAVGAQSGHGNTNFVVEAGDALEAPLEMSSLVWSSRLSWPVSLVICPFLFLAQFIFKFSLRYTTFAMYSKMLRPRKMTATLQVLRKAGRPSERAHEVEKRGRDQCSHGHEEESSALELAESDAEFDAAYKEATQALQEARTAIHEYMEEVRYELASSGVDD